MSLKSLTESKYHLVLASETLTLWHGGNLDSYQDYVAHKGGKWEYGPGLYLTTHWGTARKYAKGSRKLYRVTIEKGTDAEEAHLPLAAVKEFMDTYVLKAARRPIFERLEKWLKGDKIPAYIFLNLMNVNPATSKAAIRSSDTDKLRAFLVKNGVDYLIVDNAYGWHERMVVLFNMQKVVKKETVKPSDIEVFDLPTEFKP